MEKEKSKIAQFDGLLINLRNTTNAAEVRKIAATVCKRR